MNHSLQQTIFELSTGQEHFIPLAHKCANLFFYDRTHSGMIYIDTHCLLLRFVIVQCQISAELCSIREEARPVT
jgi:hypothetical protein